MKILTSAVILALTTPAIAQTVTCPEMDQAANAVAQINGAVSATPKYRIAPLPKMTDLGAEFNYTFNANKILPGTKAPYVAGSVTVKAIIRTGTSNCVVQDVSYVESLGF